MTCKNCFSVIGFSFSVNTAAQAGGKLLLRSAFVKTLFQNLRSYQTENAPEMLSSSGAFPAAARHVSVNDGQARAAAAL